MSKLWDELLSKETLTRGWHLARIDSQRDFAQDLFSTAAYGFDLEHLVQETINRLKTGTYQPRPLFRIEVPKGPLAFRPGSVLPIQDRVVLAAVVLLIAKDIDAKLPNAVYSWRLKTPTPKKGPIFNESDITQLPFLKRATIREEVDPWEDWYELWPEFDQETRRVFEQEGYQYLATSDIAAYFENIQLPILRDHILKYLPADGVPLVNLLCTFLETWSDRTADGLVHPRGIPQGNFVSSFLGNVFLLPLDEALLDLQDDMDIKYFRYMDDVRIFAKNRDDARRALLTMARTLRALHLNVQTAKTRIYDERSGEISQLLVDSRVDDLADILQEIHEEGGAEKITAQDRKGLVKRLDEIAKREVAGAPRIMGTKRPLEGMSLRAFLRWCTAHQLLGSDAYIDRLLAEVAKNADARLTKKLIGTARRFPRRRKIESAVLQMISDGRLIFPHQEAECLRAVRYLSTVHDDMVDHAWERVRDVDADRYLRMQAAYLLSRSALSPQRIAALRKLHQSEPDPYVQVALSAVIVQLHGGASDFVHMLIEHPNDKVRYVGKLFFKMQSDEKFAKDQLKHACDMEVPGHLCDNLPFLHLAASTESVKIREMLLSRIREPRYTHPIGGLRKPLQAMFTQTKESLEG